ncbi:FAM162A [Pelobates cultripes]|uniref:FAM162A n=1 Tax=Pelobates cultripes TaxID=61616 RepID=A0AAD1TQJ7_PELCU|nr:FAM162A [Pelobates cultripes]CAH2330638.1 FAM162A [Pelobates cultripes]
MLGSLGRSGLRSLAGRAALLNGGAGSFPRQLGVQDLAAKRFLCSKPEEVQPKDPGVSFKVPGHRPSGFEKKILIWGGRFKKQEDIPEIVSYDMVDAAKSKVRVKFAVLMMAMTIFGCIIMVILGKQAAGRHESLANINLEKKARLREEALKEQAKP